jgi:hypothetical protein
MSQPASRRASYQDVLNAPAHQVAELIDGQLHLHPRPAARHARSASALGDPTAQTVEVFRLHAEDYLLVGTYAGDQPARLPPFDAIEFDLSALWRR